MTAKDDNVIRNSGKCNLILKRMKPKYGIITNSRGGIENPFSIFMINWKDYSAEGDVRFDTVKKE
jgi:hypothetical protein